MPFIISLLSYLVLFFISVFLMVAAVFLGIHLRKHKDAQAARGIEENNTV